MLIPSVLLQRGEHWTYWTLALGLGPGRTEVNDTRPGLPAAPMLAGGQLDDSRRKRTLERELPRNWLCPNSE